MKLILVSNRVAYQDVPYAGGLTSALQAATHTLPTQWIGWSGEIASRRSYLEGRTGSVDYRVFSLNQQEHLGYYLQFSNEVLWPACHLRPTYLRLLDNAYSTYRQVNAQFAQEVASQAIDGDLIWVHDYQLMLVAQSLRNLQHQGPIGYFHHIPVPPLELMQSIPKHDDIFSALLSFDVVGVQTQQDAHNLYQYFVHYQSLGAPWQVQQSTATEFVVKHLKAGGRVTYFKAYPIGIDVQAIQHLAAQADSTKFNDEALDIASAHPSIIGVDRLDYSKGLEQKLQGFGRYLAKTTSSERPVLVQIANPTRSSVPSYQQLHMRLQAQVHELRQQYAQTHYPAIYLSHTTRDMATLAALYRRARAALVTPSKDGMNLVAKEFVAAQDPRDPGVLILSEFAGAAHELTEALLVNPFDVDQVANAIGRALEMPLFERMQRHRSMLQRLQGADIHHWFAAFVHDLQQQHHPLRLAPTGS